MHGRRRYLLPLLLGLVAVGLVMASCTQITALQAPTDQAITKTCDVTLTVKPTASANNARGTLAFRYPDLWHVQSVSYRINGGTESNAIPVGNYGPYFATTWEAKPVDALHNGHRDGGDHWQYAWWGGYTVAGRDWLASDEVAVTITFDTKWTSVGAGPSPTFYLDLIAGLTPNDDPFNESNGILWEGANAPDSAKLNVPMKLYAFVDVPPSHHYYGAIEHLANFNYNHGLPNRAIINGYDRNDGRRDFLPDNSVFRAQFAKMVVNAVGLAVDEGMTSPFTDLGPDDPASLYPNEYVASAFDAQITKGLTATTFGTYVTIPRCQVVTMVVRAIQTHWPGVLTTPTPGYLSMWGDFSDTHKESANIAQFNGLFSGLQLSGGSAEAWAPMSRAEISQILWNMLVKVTAPHQLY